MQTSNEDLLFQTDADSARQEQRRAKASRTSSEGEPIKLASLPLELLVRGNDCWIAENGFIARLLDLSTGRTRALFKGHRGPVTCLALRRLPSGKQVLYTGSWDKSIRCWDAGSGELFLTYEDAHADFVKTLLLIPELDVLVSGGSDKDLKLWHSSPTDGSFKSAAVLKAHTRPVECLALSYTSAPQVYAVWSADSMGTVCVWHLQRRGAELMAEMICTYKPHETAIYDIAVDVEHKQVWTASADKTVLLCAIDPSALKTPPQVLLRIEHPYFVRAVRPYEDFVVTASADEEIRVWDVARLLEQPRSAHTDKTQQAIGWKEAAAAKRNGDASETDAGLVRRVDAHSHEVNGLAFWTRLTRQSDIEMWLVSSSLDGTLRRWRLADLLVPAKSEAVEEISGTTESMTAEEEAELSQLMNDDT